MKTFWMILLLCGFAGLRTLRTAGYTSVRALARITEDDIYDFLPKIPPGHRRLILHEAAKLRTPLKADKPTLAVDKRVTLNSSPKVIIRKQNVELSETHSNFTSSKKSKRRIDDTERDQVRENRRTARQKTQKWHNATAHECDCDFEVDWCCWSNDDDNDRDWERDTGSQGVTNSGPPADHTTGSQDGYYAYVRQISQLLPNSFARLESPTLSGEYCLGFWFHMYGSILGSLEVKIETTRSTTIFHREGGLSAEWLYAQVRTGETRDYKIVFEVTGGLLNVGSIALDDVMLYSGSCPPREKCGFESSDWCGYENDPKNDFDWTDTKASDHHSGLGYDVTTGTGEGYYMYVDTDGGAVGETGRLRSPKHAATKGDASCITFWYHIEGDDESELRVYIDTLNGTLIGPIWSTHFDQGAFWHIGAIHHVTLQDHHIVFEVEIGSTGLHDISIDDVKITNSRCSGFRASCTFEIDQCTWTNLRNGQDDFDWIRYTGAATALEELTGPQKDHTTGTKHGWYMYLESALPADREDIGRMVSDVFMPDLDRCFQLFYHMFGPADAPGHIRVLREFTDGTEEELWTMSGDQGDQWFEALIDVPIPESNVGYRMAIEGEIDRIIAGDLAIDDTRMYNLPCVFQPEEPDFECLDGSDIIDPSRRCDWNVDCNDASDEKDCGECNFDVDMCRYFDSSRGDYQWEWASGSTITEGTGPSYDFTTGTDQGHYMLAEAHTGSIFSGSTLIGPKVREASSSCQLEFGYHMYGDNVGKLELWFVQNKQLTRLWMSRGDAGDAWHIATVPIGRISTDWMLIFMSTPLINERGDIAIDGIVLFGCDFPAVTGSCGSGEFTCDNGACVSTDVTCDLTDDCGDQSDESDYICDGYHFCDFEVGLCGYTNGDDNDADWWRHQGLSSEISMQTGPSRDHTLNNAIGHYVYVDARLPRRPGDVARLYTSNFQPGDCELTFYYHMWGEHLGLFSVYTRTEINGPMKHYWSWADNIGDYFVRKSMMLSETSNFQIVFEVIIGVGLKGDVALDDIIVAPECLEYSGDLPVGEPEPTEPSPCDAGYIHCGDDYCIPINEMCDFKEQCPNGIDEQVCGTCNFEDGQCGWRDASSGGYRWERYHTTEHTSEHAPGIDGAGREDGYYMLIRGQSSLFYLAAFMVTDMSGEIGQSCKISFMYHISGEEVGITSLHLADPEDALRLYILWIRQNDQGSEWRRAEVVVGSHGPGWRFDFESYPLLGTFTGDTSDICVDEIEFIDCHPDDNDESASELTCDFESGTCGWFQEPNDIGIDFFDWELRSGRGPQKATGPDADHTLGTSKGTYFVAPGIGNTHTWSLISTYPQPKSSPMCLEFYYHMYGATVGTLNLFQRRLGFVPTVVFSKTGTFGNQWHKYQKTLGIDDIQYQFHFEAAIGSGDSSDIAIDDISWTEGECPPSLVCDFEGREWCDWTNDDDANMRWRRGRDGTMSDNTGPKVDHTTGTPEGWYLYIETSFPRLPGWKAKLLSMTIEGGTTECLEFWYHMYGDDIGALRVYARDVETGGENPITWEKSSNQGNMWRYGTAELYSDYDYQIVIESEKGDDTKGDIAIDDLLPKIGSCGIPGHCTFDDGNMCGWTNARSNDEFDWQRDNKDTPTDGTGPDRDHTTASDKGYYMYTESSSPVTQGWSAWLISEHFDPVDEEGCFVFYYHMKGADMGVLRVYIIWPELPETKEEIWSKSGDQGDDWKEVRLPIKSQYEFQLIIEGVRGSGDKSNMAIDDTEMFYGTCDDYVPPAYPSYSSSNTGAIIFTCILLVILIIGILAGVWYYYRKKENKALVPESVSRTFTSIKTVSFKKDKAPAHVPMDNPGYEASIEMPATPKSTRDTTVLHTSA
ncbi:MAM and LDL-receptor class A domain-containing protein 1-like [Saccoglossus kowalevskii]